MFEVLYKVVPVVGLEPTESEVCQWFPDSPSKTVVILHGFDIIVQVILRQLNIQVMYCLDIRPASDCHHAPFAPLQMITQ